MPSILWTGDNTYSINYRYEVMTIGTKLLTVCMQLCPSFSHISASDEARHHLYQVSKHELSLQSAAEGLVPQATLPVYPQSLLTCRARWSWWCFASWEWGHMPIWVTVGVDTKAQKRIMSTFAGNQIPLLWSVRLEHRQYSTLPTYCTDCPSAEV